MEENRYIQSGPFDAQFNPRATMEDIDAKKVYEFVRLAQSRRKFSLDDKSSVPKILHHLNLSKGEKLTK